MKNLKKLITFVFFTLMVCLLPLSIVNATSIEIVDDLTKIDDKRTVVVEDNDEYTIFETSYEGESDEDVEEKTTPKQIIGLFKISDIKKNKTSVNRNIVLDKDTIVPGTTYSYTVSYSFTTTVTGGFGVSAKDINASLKVSSSATVKKKKSLKFTPESIFKGKKVKNCTVTYYPQYQHYKFNIKNRLTGIIVSSGTAKVLCGFKQEVKYTYK